MTYYAARVDVNSSMSETIIGGTPMFTLTVSVTNPREFPPFLSNDSPHCCFVYQKSDPNSAQPHAFLRIASIDDMKNIPTQSVSGQLYRSNTFSGLYTNDANAFTEGNLIVNNLWRLYSDIKTVYSQASSYERTEVYTLPDYNNDLLNSYITEYNNLKVTRLQQEERIKVLSEIVVPTIEFEREAFISLKEIVDNINNTFSSEVDNNATIIDNARTSSSDLMTVFQQGNEYLTAEKTRKDTSKTWSDEIVALAGSIGGTTADEIITKATNIKSQLSIGSQEEFITMADIVSKRRLINPALVVVRDVTAQKLASMTELTNLVNMIQYNLDTLNLKIKDKEQEISDINRDLDTIKRNMQTLEGKMLSLNPSIDITDPSSRWSVVINVNTGA